MKAIPRVPVPLRSSWPVNACSITDSVITGMLAGSNTLYLCAPLGDETRIGVVFAVVLHDLITQAFDRYNRTGDPLDPRLLLLLDEAANTPLPKLPQWSSTVTGAGMQLVTVWQSKAQLDQIYNRDADNVLTNHRTKLIYPRGLSDMATIEYICNLVGTEHVRSDLDEAGWNHAGERAPSRSPSTAVALLTPSVLRRCQWATPSFSTESCPRPGCGRTGKRSLFRASREVMLALLGGHRHWFSDPEGRQGALLDFSPTIAYNVGMATPSSVRFEDQVLERLNAFVAAHPGMSLSSASNRLVDEALRMQEHPLVIFRDGPTGRRPRLVGGPDVWEVIAAVESARAAEPGLGASDVVALVADTAGLVPQQVRAALAYWADYPREIDDFVRQARAETNQARLRWEREQELLGR